MSLRSLFQEKLIEVETKGRQEGLQQEITLVIRQLNRKISYLSPELEIKIRGLAIEKIEELGEDLLDFTSPQDLITWLDTH